MRALDSKALATAVALGLLLVSAGGGTAMALKGKNTVDSGDIKAGNVKTADLAANAVDGSKVLDGSLGSADVEGLTGADIDESTLNIAPSPCPAGTIRVGVGCIETSSQAAVPWPAASQACGQAGRRLPSIDELNVARNVPGIELDANNEFSSQVQVLTETGTSTNIFVVATSLNDDGFLNNEIVKTGGTGDIDPGTVSKTFRCVAELP